MAGLSLRSPFLEHHHRASRNGNGTSSCKAIGSAGLRDTYPSRFMALSPSPSLQTCR